MNSACAPQSFGAPQHNMKKCTYCGTEYPDDALICSIDKQPLQSDVPTPGSEAGAANSAAFINSLRPNSVKLAIGCLTVSFVISLIQELTIIRADLRTRFGYLIIGFFLVLFLVLMIYRRKNWARWVYAGFVVIWVWRLISHFRFLAEFSIIDRVMLVVHLALWIAAACFLFVPSSNEWFRLSLNRPASQEYGHH
jgi:hypothetical protein